MSFKHKNYRMNKPPSGFKSYGNNTKHKWNKSFCNNSNNQFNTRVSLKASTTNGNEISKITALATNENTFIQPKPKIAPMCTYNQQIFNPNYHQNFVSTKKDFKNNLSYCSSKALPGNGTSSASSNYSYSSNTNNGISRMICNGSSNTSGDAVKFENRPVVKFDKPQFSRIFVVCPKNLNEMEIYATFQRFGQIEEIIIVDDLSSFREKLDKG
jgi:hypothetical protein